MSSLGTPVRISQPESVTTHQVLDPHPEATGQVDARLDRHHVAGWRAPSPSAGTGAAPRGPQGPRRDPARVRSARRGRRRRSPPRAAPSTSRPLTPARTALQAGQLRLEHELVDGVRLVVELAGGEGPRAIRAVAVEHRSPVDHDQLTGGDLDVARLGVGQCAVRPGGDDRGERQAGGAVSARIARSSESATAASVRPTSPSAMIWRRPASAICEAARMRSISAGSLTARSASTAIAGRDELDGRRHQLAQVRRGRGRSCSRPRSRAARAPAGSSSGTPASRSSVRIRRSKLGSTSAADCS